MLSIFRCLSRRTINSFSSSITSVSQQSQNNYQKTWHSTHDNNNKNKNNDNDFENEETNDEKYSSNSHAFSECKYNLLTSRLLETVGYVGAAIVVGLNFETRFSYGDKSCKRDVELVSSVPSQAICGDCKYCIHLLYKLKAFASPVKHSYVFNPLNHTFIATNNNNKNNNNNNNNDKIEKKERRHEKSSVSDEIPIPLEEVKDPIDDICRQLQKASIDYTEQLNNMLGIALIETDPSQAMRCWSNCSNNPKALFNKGVAFETGKHSSEGKVDLMRAYQHYALSAAMGHKHAIYNLSLFYLYGKGHIQTDLNRANALLERAAQLGVKPAKQFCDRLKSQNNQNYKTYKSIERPIMRTSASAPNLSVMSHPFYDSVINEKSNLKNNLNQSMTYKVQ